MDFTVDDSVAFYGVLKSIRRLLKLLSAIKIKNYCNCFIHEEGIMITIERERSVKVIAYFKTHLFNVFIHKENVTLPEFALPLDVFMNCLRAALPRVENVFPAQTMIDDYCEMKYDGTGSYLTLNRRVQKYHQVLTFEIFPSEPEAESSQLLFEESSGTESQKLIMKSLWFKQLMSDLDSRYDKFTIKISPEESMFGVVAKGPDLLSEFDFGQSSESFISFSCNKELEHSYFFSDISLCKKALDLSHEVSIDMFDSGALTMTFSIEGSGTAMDSIEFNFLPSRNFA